MTHRLRPRRTGSLVITAALCASGLVTGTVLAQQKEPPSAQQDSTQLRGNDRRTGAVEEVVAPPLTLLWKFTGGSQNGNPSSPVVAGDTVYYSTGSERTQGGALYAVDTRTGAEKWKFTIPGSTDIFNTAPLFSGGKIYIGSSDRRMYVIDANTGRQVAALATGVAANSSPAILDGILFYGAADGRLNVLDPVSATSPWNTGKRNNEYKAGDAINSAPIAADSFIYFTSADQFVHALKSATGVFRWRVRLPFRFVTNPLVYSDNTLFAATGPRITAIQPTSGNVRWTRDFPNDLASAPVVSNGVVYVVDRNKTMYALRANNGKDYWERDRKPFTVTLPYSPSAAPTLSGDTIYIPTARGLILAVNKEDGTVKWQYTLTPTTNKETTQPNVITAISAPITVARGTIFAVSDDGSLSAFTPDAPDNTAPTVDRFYPRAGDRVSGKPPLTIAAYVKDAGSGVDNNSIKLMLDNQSLTPVFDGERNLVYFQTKSTGKLIDNNIPDGRHQATLTVKDWRGNEESVSWSFVVDNALKPTSSREAPSVRPGINAPRGNTPPPATGRGGGRRPR